MDVFLVPVGADAYQPYCEVAIEAPGPSGDAARASWWTRWWKGRMHRFRQLMADAEEERARSERGHAVKSRGLWRAVLRRLAKVVAEQRLLWHLRVLTQARLVHADDLHADRALEILKAEFQRDFERHRRWCVIDTLLFLPFIVLTVIPGPNIPALFFSFRAIGHFLSMRGAAQGLRVVVWDRQANAQVTAIRDALTLDARARTARLDEIASALGLDRLAAFVERVSKRPS